ncbi:site-2 protease family protein [Cellulosilyticum sp. I15G10I2]|uniref:site-2 protease family protein n=1 Tax=Cellulosilyticum sp. I15G10I2 TaxID=1892843 RepID=UPI00085BB870|nr:site-2 protease family protein [Cellulosilyticum sp. I15G10I2]
MDFIKELIYTIPAILIAISMHEFAHGYMSYRLGDPTPKYHGRLSLNPLQHLDPMGTLCLLIFHFGWAKPVRVNPHYYQNKKRGMVMVAMAGPIMNFGIAFIATIAMGIILKVTGGQAGLSIQYIFRFFSYLTIINIGLGVFNLIPVPPLDGSKVLGAILPEDKYFKYMQYERYGHIILIILIMFNLLDLPLRMMRSGLNSWMWAIVQLIFQLS